MLRLFFSTILTVTVAAGAAGQTFDVRPGQLAAERAVPSHAATITVTGSVDASDLDYLVSAIEEAQMLDLSGADIAAYKGGKVGVNTYSSPADALPAYLLAGLKASHLRLPATLTAIGEGALMDSRIEDVTIPAGVTKIGADAFAQCRNLTHVELPAGLSEMADRTFEGCEMLAEVTLPGSLRSIGRRAFLGCSSLQAVEPPASLTTIGDEAFALSGLNGIALDGCKSLTAIGNRAFASCIHLASATLPSDATKLGEGIFFGCTSLSSVRLPAEAVNLPALTLKGAENLTEIVLPEGISEIGALAMAGMSAVERVTLPPSLEHIADGAMEGWNGAKEIDATQLGSVPTLGADIWADVRQPDVTLHVRPNLEDSFLAAPQWQDFAINKSSITILPAYGGNRPEIEACFQGKTLTVKASEKLKSVTLYSIDGRVLAVADKTDATQISLETSGHAGVFFIVRAVTQPDGGVMTIKLMREP